MYDQFINLMLERTTNEKEIKRLEKLRKVIKDKQFVDIKDNATRDEYYDFLRSMNRTYLGTVTANSLFLGESHKYGRHSDLELNYPLFNGLSINQICTILDSLDLYTICKIIDDNLKVNKYVNEDQELINLLLTGIDSFGNYFDILPINIDGNTITYNKKIINKINAYEQLYRKTRLPIGTILSSINTVNTGYDMDNKPNSELVGKIFEYQESCPEKILTKKK